MNRFCRNLVAGLLVIAISAGAAIATSVYLTHKGVSALSMSKEANFGFESSPFSHVHYNMGEGSSIDFTGAAENSVHAVVHIKAVTNASAQRRQYIDPFEYFFGGGHGFQQQPQPRVGAGSGVIISEDGYIMTNNHVIERADELEVTLNDNRKFTAKLIGADPTTDIALIKIDAKDLPTIPFGDSEALKVGEWVLAVGNPFNLTSTVTAGIVSAKGRGGISQGNGSIESFIQTDAAVNPGNSGGALVNTKGELVGINTAIYSTTGNFAGYSFAVPVSIAGKVVSDLRQYGAVQRAVLGVLMRDIQSLPDEEKSKLNVLEGAYVSDFAEHSASREAGIEKGDIITEVDGVKIKSGSNLQEQISKHRPGDKVKVAVNRYGKVKTFSIELRNTRGNTEVVQKSSNIGEALGAAFRELSDRQKEQLGIDYGIEVTAVADGKLREAGITKGYIILLANEQRISTPDELETIAEAVRNSLSDEKVLLLKGIYPTGRTKYYAIELTD